jgi:exopolyphosphatase/guanosine-5'-triphosphate,3'-diphosphate pyrophosphatase
MARAMEVIESFHKIAKKHHARHTIAVATSAVRDAKNGGRFVEYIRKRTGIKVEVVTGEEEARLIFLSAIHHVDSKNKRCLVIDIGGGSMELILGNAKDVRFMDSYKLGVARLTDRFISHDPPLKKEIRRMKEHVRKKLAPAIKKIKKAGFAEVIGTSGTMINIGSLVHEKRYKTPLRRVNHFHADVKTFDKVYRDLVQSEWRERIKMRGLDPKRLDIIIAGAVLVKTILKMLDAHSLTLSSSGIREGIILDFINKNGTIKG